MAGLCSHRPIKGYTSNNRFVHSCGHEFETRLSHLLDRKKCPICHGKWRSKEMFQKSSNEIHNNEYEILEFKSGNLPVKIKHKICNKIFTQIGHRHLRGDRCDFCHGNVKLSKEEIVEMSNRLWNNEYEILSKEVHYDKKSKIRHTLCGYEYDQMIFSHLRGYSCPKCAGNAKHTKESIQEKSNKIHNNEYEILSEIGGNSYSKIIIKHKDCGREFTQVINDHLSGCGCSFCNLSKFENFIDTLLTQNKVNFNTQKTFEGCKFKNKLKFDFYLVDKNICIEFDGIQHFKSIRFFGGDKSFELQKIKDKIKNEFCEKEGIKLIRFRYDQSLEYIKEEVYKLIH